MRRRDIDLGVAGHKRVIVVDIVSPRSVCREIGLELHGCGRVRTARIHLRDRESGTQNVLGIAAKCNVSLDVCLGWAERLPRIIAGVGPGDIIRVGPRHKGDHQRLLGLDMLTFGAECGGPAALA
ncbi:hypothetical protein D9M68_894170 [compost metagenome]